MTSTARAHQTLAEYRTALASGAISATALLDDMLARAATGAGQAVYTQLFERGARAEAASVDARHDAGVPLGPLAGLPISIKDLFDVAGAVTRSGSRLLADQPPARADAGAVRRLRHAGAVMIGHTNMTEFAYSGLGLNPHYGTPPNPLAPERIPGGSSSGAAVSVARGMAAAALGTDTGGSVRIPAAFCGLAGFKPTQNRVPRDGMFPLSRTLDSIGPIAPSVACCARLDAVLRGAPPTALEPAAVRGLRLTSPSRYVLDDLDDGVSRAFERTLQRLSTAGARVTTLPFDILERTRELGHNGGFTAPESYQVHRHWLARRADEYDPRVRMRIEQGAATLAADYLDLHRLRAELMATVDHLMADCDALVMPTVPIVPPRFTALQNDTDYLRVNALVLRNPTVANLLGLCAMTVPCHHPDELPVGLMLVGRNGADPMLLKTAAAVEALLNDSQ